MISKHKGIDKYTTSYTVTQYLYFYFILFSFLSFFLIYHHLSLISFFLLFRFLSLFLISYEQEQVIFHSLIGSCHSFIFLQCHPFMLFSVTPPISVATPYSSPCFHTQVLSFLCSCFLEF